VISAAAPGYPSTEEGTIKKPNKNAAAPGIMNIKHASYPPTLNSTYLPDRSITGPLASGNAASRLP
jgi:hypothetical protein